MSVLCCQKAHIAILFGDLLDVYEHPNKERYSNQQILIVQIQDYAYLVPFVEDEKGFFLKTIFFRHAAPSTPNSAQRRSLPIPLINKRSLRLLNNFCVHFVKPPSTRKCSAPARFVA